MNVKSVGFPISHKENENRRVIIPKDIKLMSMPERLYFEKNYGNILGISDNEYADLGCNICCREEVLTKNIICDLKVGDADYLDKLNESQIVFGWIHATQNKNITDKLLENKVTAYAWEKMFKDGRHVFYRNNELSGEAAVMHAFQCYGRMPYETKVAVIGAGNTARGAVKILDCLGADVTQYNRRTENLLKKELNNFDVIMNCIIWDISRNDHIIYSSDLVKMKKGAMIVDVSCDCNGAIETSVPTTISNPTYELDGVLHYAVDHIPAIFYKTFTYDNSEIIREYLEDLQYERYNRTLEDALIIKNGLVVDDEINKFQKR